MYYDTREEAQKEIEKLRKGRAELGMPPVERRIVESAGGRYEIVTVKHCSRCGGEVFDAFSLPILCPTCRKQRHSAAVRELWQEGERRRREYEHSLDAERVQQ